jgi:REP element-mobilizing transposase RayT
MPTKDLTPLQPGAYYHIYNRGNNGEDLFIEERNYRYFLQLYAQHVAPAVDTFAYCLLKNHFHFLLRIKTEAEYLAVQNSEAKPFKPSQFFSNWFNAYTKAINKAYSRSGSLFQERFGRIAITSDAYFTNLIFYIHFNPQKHGFVHDFRQWNWSSYHALASQGNTQLNRAEVIGWFGSSNEFQAFHRGMVNEWTIAPLIEDDLL